MSSRDDNNVLDDINVSSIKTANLRKRKTTCEFMSPPVKIHNPDRQESCLLVRRDIDELKLRQKFD